MHLGKIPLQILSACSLRIKFKKNSEIESFISWTAVKLKVMVQISEGPSIEDFHFLPPHTHIRLNYFKSVECVTEPLYLCGDF
jgi:hypothetical protein